MSLQGVFVRKANELLRRLRDEAQLNPGERSVPLSDSELDYFVKAIEDMRDQAQRGSLAPKSQRYQVLTRIIADQWPLGSALGNDIGELERMFVDL